MARQLHAFLYESLAQVRQKALVHVACHRAAREELISPIVDENE